jgi:hypothetical protein
MHHRKRDSMALFLIMWIGILSWNPPIHAADAHLGWNADNPTPSGYKIYYGTSSGSYGTSSDVGNQTSGTITGLNTAGKYYLVVRAYNNAGQSAPSNEVHTLSLTAVGASSLTSSSATISWRTDEAGDSQIVYGTTTAYGSSSTLNTSLTTTHSVALSGLNASTLYHYRVSSKSGSGNGVLWNDYTFTTQTAADTTPPVISGVASSGVTSSAATISWTTNEASDSQVDFGTTTTYGASTPLNGSLVTSHSVSLSGLTASTTYNTE